MTLVVAKKVNDPTDQREKTIILFSDTRVSEHGLSSFPQNGVIKTNIIHDNLAISWSGVVSIADEFFRNNTALLLKKTKEEVTQCVLDYHLQKKQEIDFIICFGEFEKGEEVEIVVIKNGSPEESSFAWIGVQESFRFFQKKLLEYLRQYELDTGEEPKLLDPFFFLSFREVIAEQLDLHKEVGDFLIQASYSLNDRKFLFQNRCEIVTPQKPTKAKGFLSVGDTSTGSYTICYCADPKNSKRLALYFYQIRLGWVFEIPKKGGIMQLPKDNIIKDISASDFERALKNRYQIEVPIQSFN